MTQLAAQQTPLATPAPAFTAGPRRRRRTDADAQRASAYIYIGVVVAIALFGIPFIWIVLTSLATPAQLSQGALGLLDFQPYWQNFVDAFTMIDFPAYAMNSVILSLIISVLTTAVSATVGFGFARLRGRGRNLLFAVVIATMMIPSIATLIPTYVLFSRLGMVGTYWPWVLWGLAGTPYLIFLFRQFFTSIPLELEDAAIIDGCNWWRIYFSVFLPLAKPVLLTSFILSFTWTWGDYLAPALLLNFNNTTLAVATAAGYLDPRGNGLLTVQAAGAILYLLPVVVIFLFAQRYFMGSAVSSGVKG
ncbi:carbohydrate ABC transporter permease [Microbacterium sp. B2969]|uniref:Carbohydrate ABC transporter permease n=1 Tax=Microbacterium alkaliflavum TaxID=3248839 RepID=A0ABW7QDK6_9MICO